MHYQNPRFREERYIYFLSIYIYIYNRIKIQLFGSFMRGKHMMVMEVTPDEWGLKDIVMQRRAALIYLILVYYYGEHQLLSSIDSAIMQSNANMQLRRATGIRHRSSRARYRIEIHTPQVTTAPRLERLAQALYKI